MAGVKGKSGTKPKPNNKKVLAGSKHVNTDAVEFDLLTGVEAPQWLGDLAKKMWETLVPHLCKENVLAVTDLHNLEAFCSAYQTFRDADEHIRTKGLVVTGATGGPVKNPSLTAKNEAMKQMSSFGSSLGLDPASRGRLIGGGVSSKSIGEFDEF